MLRSTQRNIVLISMLVSILYLGFKLLTWKYQVATHHFMMRDFIRAQNILKGELIWYGPELNFGGYLPGPAYYYLLQVPLLFTQSFMGVVFWAYILTAVAVALMFRYMWKYHGKYPAIIALALFINSDTHNAELYKVWNPTFTIVFNLLLVTLLLSFLRDKKNKLLYWSAFIIGIGIQLHLSVIFHWITILTIFSMQLYRGVDLKEVIRTFAKTFALFLLPIMPYLIWSYSNMSSEVFSVISESNAQFFHFAKIVNDLLNRLTGIGPIWGSALAISVICVFRWGLLKVPQNSYTKEIILIYLAHVLINFPLSYSKYRYLLPYQSYAIVLFSIVIGLAFIEAFKRTKFIFRYRMALLFSVLILAFVFELSGNYSSYKKVRVEASYSLRQVRNNYWRHLLSDYIEIVSKVYREKRWSPEEFEDRVYHFVSSSFEIGTHYRNFHDRNLPKNSTEAQYDGLIIFPISGKFKVMTSSGSSLSVFLSILATSSQRKISKLSSLRSTTT